MAAWWDKIPDITNGWTAESCTATKFWKIGNEGRHAENFRISDLLHSPHNALDVQWQTSTIGFFQRCHQTNIPIQIDSVNMFEQSLLQFERDCGESVRAVSRENKGVKLGHRRGEEGVDKRKNTARTVENDLPENRNEYYLGKSGGFVWTTICFPPTQGLLA